MRYTIPVLIATSLLTACPRSKPNAEQAKDTAAMATCVANHWGEDWTQLMAACSGQGVELFYDIVSDVEAAAAKPEAGPAKTPLYTMQQPIAHRLRLRDAGGQ